jgi:pyruvate dehydrogenase E1 component beta subunit
MAIELKMPALSPTMEEGTLAKWLVKEGDAVKSGDILAEIETDKATMEFEAVDEGVIASIAVPEGTDNVKVGTVIALIAGEDESENSQKTFASGEGERPGGGAPTMGVSSALDTNGNGGVDTSGAVRTEPEKEQPTPTAQAAPTPAKSDPAIPAGTAMTSLTLREALRAATTGCS